MFAPFVRLVLVDPDLINSDCRYSLAIQTLAAMDGERARRSSSVSRRRRFFGGEVVATSSVAPSPPPSEELQGLLLDITVHDTMGC